MRIIVITLMVLMNIIYVNAQNNTFNILFKHDFNSNSPGLYNHGEWQGDWNSPPYSNGLEKTKIVDLGNGDRAMQWNYPKGSVGPSQGGGQWEAPFTGQDEVYLSYNIKFKPGFDWVEGGKLPGLGGGPAYGSGTPMEWDEGFSARLMWRFGENDGKVMFYAYYQNKTGIYGAGHPWSDNVFVTTPERWYNMTVRLVLNSIDQNKLTTDPQHAGNTDGLMEGFIDGKLVCSVTGICFRNLPSIKIDDMHITSFFGGNGSNYAAARDEWNLLDDVYLFTYASGVNVPRGHTPSPTGRVLQLPNLKSGISVPPPPPTLPAIPSGLMVSLKTSSSVSLKWTDNSTDESGFRLQRSTNATSGFVQIAGAGANTTNFTDAGVNPSTTYFYRIQSYNATGSSDWSNTVSATTEILVPPSSGSGKMACWPLDNCGTDVTGNNFNLSLYNGATFTTDNKQGGHSMCLDGSDDYAACPNINLGNEFTLAAWVKIPSGRSNIQTIIANGASGSNSNGFKILVNTYSTSDRKISFESGDGTNASISRSAANVFEYDKWNYITVAVNRSTGSARIYYNGTDVTADAGVHKNFKNSDVMRLGRMSNNNFGMKGELDHVDVFTRQLSGSEILSAMAASEPITVKAPSTLSASSASSKVSLTWKDNADNETGFLLERSLSSASGFSALKNLDANQTSYTDNQVNAGKQYYYRVKAVNNSIESSFSNTASVTVIPPVPAVPSNLDAANVLINSLKLTWSDNDANEDGFRLERSLNPTSGFEQITSAASGVTSFDDSGLSENTVYYYRVSSYNIAGNSAWSPVLSVTTSSKPVPATNVFAYWPLDNSGADLSGHGHNLTCCNGISYVSDCKKGLSSAKLDGRDDYAASPSVDPGDNFTVTAWVKIPSGTLNIQTVIANGPSGSVSDGFKLMVNTYGTTDKKIIFESGDGTTSAVTRSAANAFSFDQWNYIAVTINKTTGVVRLFCNGTDVTSESGVHKKFKTSSILRLGQMTNSNFGLKGQLDEVFIYNKVLSSSELLASMNVNFLSPPTGLSSGNITVQSADLSWTDNAEQETGFTLQRSTDPLSGFETIATLGSNAHSFQDAGLSDNTTYYYRVSAFTSAENSTWSNTLTLKTEARTISDMFAYWPLDNSCADMAGHGYDLTRYNGTGYSTDNQQGSASLLLEDADDFASSPYIDPGNEFTLCMWVKMPSGRINIQTLMANGASGSSSDGFKVLVNTYASSDRKISFESGNGMDASITRTKVEVFDFDCWNHIAVTVNKNTGVVRLYYNGTDVTAESGVHKSFRTGNAIRLGRMTNNLFGMKGQLDDVRIYKRLLSSAEILTVAEESSNQGYKAARSGEENATEEIGSIDDQTRINPIQELTFNTYPNPFINTLNISNAGNIDRIELIDLSGKVLKSIRVNGETICTLNTENLPSGIYLVKVTGKNTFVKIQKVIRY